MAGRSPVVDLPPREIRIGRGHEHCQQKHLACAIEVGQHGSAFPQAHGTQAPLDHGPFAEVSPGVPEARRELRPNLSLGAELGPHSTRRDAVAS